MGWKWKQSFAAGAAGLFGLVVAIPQASATTSVWGGVWFFGHNSGLTVNDLSGNGLTATLGGSSTPNTNDPTWIQLPNSKLTALHFNGSDYLSVPDAPSLDSAQITVGAIVRATSPGQYRYVVSKGAIACDNASYGLYTGASGGLEFYVSNGNNSVTLSPDAGTGVWDGKWHVIVGTYDGSSVHLYVDGKQIGTGTPSTVSIDYNTPDGNQFAMGDYIGSCPTPLGFVGDMLGVGVLQTAVTSINYDGHNN